MRNITENEKLSVGRGTQLFNGTLGEPLRFRPTSSRYYEIVRQRPDMDEDTRAVFSEMIRTFRNIDHASNDYLQLPRMGRAVFSQVPEPGNGFVMAKGNIRRSSGSESVRQFRDERWRSIFGEDAGFTRVEIDSGISLLISHKPTSDGKAIELFEAIPEGYSYFPDLLMEYQLLRNVYEPLPIRTPLPLGLFRHIDSLPWWNQEDAKRFINGKLRDKLPPRVKEQNVVFNEGPFYHVPADLDSGLIFRHFRSAIRPQDFYDLAIAGNWELLQAAQVSAENYPLSLLQIFAASAGQLIQHGIIHGELYFDYQNFTIAGEICDGDATTIPPQVNPHLHSKVISLLEYDDSLYNTQMANTYRERLQNVAPDALSAAKSLLEQSYYLWDASLRAIDIQRRSNKGIDSPGTVLSQSEINELLRQFVSIMVKNLGENGKKFAKMACEAEVDINHDFRTPIYDGALLKTVLAGGLATIQGWTKPDKPFNHFIHRTTQADIDYIIEDYNKFKQAVLQAF